MSKKLNEYLYGVILCIAIAIPAWFLGKSFPIVGGPVFGIIIGMIVGMIIKDKEKFSTGVFYCSKKVLNYAVIFLGFGLNLSVIFDTGKQSLPIIISTIATSLIVSFVLCKALHIDHKISTLVGVGSSICGGSAIAATAPVINADHEEVAQAISVIFFFNIIAALIFPALGSILGFSTTSGTPFGIFAGTAINDTSSVTAAASTWDTINNLGVETLDKAVMVKLTRTLAIIPITLVLAIWESKRYKDENAHFSLKKVFPFFIIYFICASIITTVAVHMGVGIEVFAPLKTLSKILIVIAMSAIGFNTNIVKLVKTGGKPLLIGLCCWVSITIVSLCMQHVLHIW